METLVQKGKVRSIGVSNFTKGAIEDLLETYDEPQEDRERKTLLADQHFHI